MLCNSKRLCSVAGVVCDVTSVIVSILVSIVIRWIGHAIDWPDLRSKFGPILVLRETKLDTSQPQVIQVPVGIFVVPPEKVYLAFDHALVPAEIFLDCLSLAKLAIRVRQRLLFRARLSVSGFERKMQNPAAVESGNADPIPLLRTSSNKSGRNKIRFSHLDYILQYSFWVGFESEKVKSLYWYLEKTQSQHEAHCHDHGM